MTTAGWTVIALLWMVVLALVMVVLALARQIGVLHERLRPVGALQLAQGLKVGEPAPVVEAQSLTQGISPATQAHTVSGNTLSAPSLRIGSPHAEGRDTLVMFLSPTCPVCKSLLPSLRAIFRHEQPRIDVILASDGSRLEHLDFIATESLDEFPYVLSESLGVTYGVGRLPYAVLIDGKGIVRATGLVNTREQLDSLFEAKEHGVANVQELAAREQSAAGKRREVA
jgi:methylamine dehydrogenase accessory protein MauD